MSGFLTVLLMLDSIPFAAEVDTVPPTRGPAGPPTRKPPAANTVMIKPRVLTATACFTSSVLPELA